MSETPAARTPRGADKAATPAEKRPLLRKLLDLVAPGPDSRDQLMESLADAEQKELIEPESRMMLEGVIRMADMTAGDVMVPSSTWTCSTSRRRTRSCCTSSSTPATRVSRCSKSRRDNVIGILMAKDLLKLQRSPDLNLRTLLRPAFFVPESKPLNDLLRDFRTNRNHLAIVIDEFGHTAGSAHDRGRARGDRRRDRGRVRRAATPSRASTRWPTAASASPATRPSRRSTRPSTSLLPTDEFDTIGGLVAHELGRVPRRGESVTIGGLVFAVMLARGGAVRWFKVTRAAEEALGSDGA